MRCKPGQLAWINHTDVPLRANIGAIVRTISLHNAGTQFFGEPCWSVDAPAGVLAARGGRDNYEIERWPGGPGLVVQDSALTPINDPDMDVDTVEEKDIEHVQ